MDAAPLTATSTTRTRDAADPNPKLQVPAANDVLAREVQRLHKAVAELTTRLEPVRLAREEHVAGDGKLRDEFAVPLAAQLAEHADHVRHAHEQLAHLIEELEV